MMLYHVNQEKRRADDRSLLEVGWRRGLLDHQSAETTLALVAVVQGQLVGDQSQDMALTPVQVLGEDHDVLGWIAHE